MGSVSDDANDRNLGLFSDLEAPSINDGVVELTFKSSKQDGYPVWSENKSKLIQQYVRFFILVTIEQVLVPGSIREKEATFCLLDQRTFECKWDTVRKIAEYKKTNTKIEQFYFLAVGWLGRSIAALKDDKKLREWWGRDDIELPRSTSHSVELARLFSHRFMRELGYASAAAWPIYERSDGGRGKVMYYMIHATDHEEAPKLMNRAYKAATLASQPMEHTQACFDGEGFDLGDIAKRYDANE